MLNVFNTCDYCGGTLKEIISEEYAFWMTKKVLFKGVPVLVCEECNETFLQQDIAIVTQEITRAIYDMKMDVDIVDISKSYEDIILLQEDIYNLLINGTLKLPILDKTLIIPEKDIKSIMKEYKDSFMLAARNSKDKGFISEDVKKEIEEMKKNDD